MEDELNELRDKFEYEVYESVMQSIRNLPIPTGVHFTIEEVENIEWRCNMWLGKIKALAMYDRYERYSE